MNVLFLDQFSEIGGAQRCLLDLLPAITGRGWQARVAIPTGGPLVDALRARDVPVEEIPCGPYGSGGKSAHDVWLFASDMRSQAQAISRWMNQFSFDLLYVNGPRLLPAAARAVGGRAPVLFHAHSRIHQRYARTLAGWAIRRSKATVVACSRHVVESLRPYAPAAKFQVIPNGTADLGFRERTFGRDAPWRIGLVGRVSQEKGQAELLRAAALLKPRFSNLRFVLCGAPLFGASRYEAKVRALSDGLPVDFLGWREDIASVFEELDLLVVPSKHEGMGRVVVEAFSAGVPVVAFPAGGVPEVIAGGETGFLTAESSPEALAARIAGIVATAPETLRAMARKARRAWELNYRLDIYQARITDLMERLVSDRPAASETAAPQART